VGSIESVNVGQPKPYRGKGGRSGIDKQPTAGPVQVSVPGWGASGVAGDAICDKPNHGGPDQAVYAYAREDLAWWEAELGRSLRGGFYGENLTTAGVEVTGAVVGEVWAVGGAVLQVTSPRIPCATFQDQLREEQHWVKRFTLAARPGAYFRVLQPGEVSAGDEVVVRERPDSPLTIGVMFRALTRERDLLPLVLDSPHVSAADREWAARRVPAR
jgi:MOSC domain-containing protein YiiM